MPQANPVSPPLQAYVHPVQLAGPRWRSSVKRTLLGILLAGVLLVASVLPVAADPGRFLKGPDAAELSAELATLRAAAAAGQASFTANQRQRLNDLETIEAALARSDDRAQLSNRTAHNLGLFARYKKDPATQPPSFFVLGPGHSSDDDFDLVALLIPAGVSLQWGDAEQSAAVSATSRVIRVLEGQQLTVLDPTASAVSPAEAAQSAVATPTTGTGGKVLDAVSITYRLSQPPFQVLGRWEALPSLPDLSQAALDQQAETAPLD